MRARLAKHDELLAGVRQEAAERLAQVAAEAQLAASECLVAGCFRARLAEVVGALPEGWAFDDDLSNATVLTAHIRENRKLLWRLLRAHMSGDRQWRERHPANAVFLRQLAARGVDVRAWLAAQPRVYACASAGGGRVRLYAEREPLRILQMGNYFGTCLSSDGVNAFSAVANACELNKRVLYATEGAEGPGSSARVDGRQLIAISAEGKLVGFRVYTGLTDRRGDEALRKLFRRYVAAFAARCGLELADDGTVPTLFAESWYDDGIVPWAQELSARVSKGV